jgi:phosphate transport system substrate-binding protein
MLRGGAGVVIAALLALSLAGCGATAPGHRADAPAARVAAADAAAQRETASFQNIGSDTLVNLALAWAEAYMDSHPGIRISVTGGGSGTGIAALVNGTTQIANASREMSKEELEAARKNGIEPVRFTVALDAIAVVVNPENPVSALSLPQLSDIYRGKLGSWRQVGGEERPIVLLSRESNSGTYVYFLEQVVRLGRKKDPSLFSPETLLMPSSEGISVEVTQNPNALGYDGLGYVTRGQKVLALSRAPGGPGVLPSAATVNDGTYPVSRPLFMYTAGAPSGAVKEYLDWILGDGQGLVAGLGFVPLGGGGGKQ